MDGTHGKDFVLTNYARHLIQVKARQLCRRREFLPADQADLQQELWLMLCEHADAFDPAKASLDTIIDRVVNTAVGVILRNRQRQDIDNLQKALLDALAHGGAYADDSQVVRLEITKREPVAGGKTVVRIREAGC